MIFDRESFVAWIADCTAIWATRNVDGPGGSAVDPGLGKGIVTVARDVEGFQCRSDPAQIVRRQYHLGGAKVFLEPVELRCARN